MRVAVRAWWASKLAQAVDFLIWALNMGAMATLFSRPLLNQILLATSTKGVSLRFKRCLSLKAPTKWIPIHVSMELNLNINSSYFSPGSGSSVVDQYCARFNEITMIHLFRGHDVFVSPSRKC